MKEKIVVVFTITLLGAFGLVHGQDPIQISDTQTWTDLSIVPSGGTLEILDGGDLTLTARSKIDNNRHVVVYPGGKIAFAARLDFNSGGTATMYGGEFYSTVDTKFPDSNSGAVFIWLHGGLMVHSVVESRADRGSELHMGGGVFRTGRINERVRYDPSTVNWNIQPIFPYDQILITDLGGNVKEVTATAPNTARDPAPEHGSKSVPTSQATLSWTNPDPNVPGSPIFCDVYFGTDPNRPEMDKVTLGADVSSVELSAANFPRFVLLTNKTDYYWVVDCHDPSLAPLGDLIPGLFWTFYTNDNFAPVVDAGPDQAAWLGMSGVPGQETISLQGAVSDDGLPDPPGTYTVKWTQVDNGAAAVAISPDTVEGTVVTITARGIYEFVLTADDGEWQTLDTVRIVVGSDSCDASHLSTGGDYNPADQNRDCIVDLQDFAAIIAVNWLDCTDVLAGCGK